ncbi:MAG TPA: 50S ribosomal protein L24 [Thermoanaerobaculia bacterium]|nr:50S ribosomal protein L24 [Thermoanaerobaculia bacterium]
MLRTNRKKNEREAAPRRSHVRKNDEVIVIAGRDRGKRGKVLRVNPSEKTAIVERVNFVRKATRKNPSKNQQGGILEREAPIRTSNLMVVCPSCGEPSRTRRHRAAEGVSRACAKCDAELVSK